MHLGPLEVGIILVIIILLFGVGRISRLFGEFGSGIHAFRQGIKGDEDEGKDEKASEMGK